MNHDTILSVCELSVQYLNTGADVHGISFAVKRGKVLGLLGESGSGKSTICNAILGLLDNRTVSKAGSIRLFNKEILPLSWDARGKINGKEIGVVLQNPIAAFNPCLKIKGHFIETLCTHLLCSRRDAVLYGLDMLGRVGLHDGQRVMNSYPFQLSGGMLQRVMVAIAISLNPVLIIADEPTTALDMASQNIVLELLSYVMQEYKPAMLLVSHDIEVMAAMADDIAVMQKGKIVEYAARTQIMEHPQAEFTKELLAAASTLGVISCLK